MNDKTLDDLMAEMGASFSAHLSPLDLDKTIAQAASKMIDALHSQVDIYKLVEDVFNTYINAVTNTDIERFEAWRRHYKKYHQRYARIGEQMKKRKR